MKSIEENRQDSLQKPPFYSYEWRQEQNIKYETLKTRYAKSELPPKYIGLDFEVLNQSENVAFCKRYTDEFNPETSKGIRLIGNLGTWKTSIMGAMCNVLIRKGYKCYFAKHTDLMNKFIKHASENYQDITKPLKKLMSFDIVFIDDIGREKYTDAKKSYTFQIIDDLLNYEVTTCISANPEMIAKMKSDNELNAIIDRLKDLCPISLEFKGESFRGNTTIERQGNYKELIQAVMDKRRCMELCL